MYAAYAGSGVHPDQGGLPSRGRPSDSACSGHATRLKGSKREEGKSSERGDGTLLTL